MAEVQVSTVSLNYLERAIDNVHRNVVAVGAHVAQVDQRVAQVDAELQALQREVVEMVETMNKQFALQRAVTEIIRVRQEVEQRFGHHQQVRDAMLGILQAVDSGIVSQESIGRVSEELMINTPEYWLAPCVVALAYWIQNDKAMAYKALKVGFDRDSEKTSLLFAIICRRNGHTDACFKWLQLYLSQQKAKDMNQNVMAFVEAYANGIFGNDKDKICEDTITSWMDELKEVPGFDESQKSYWKKFFNTKGLQARYRSDAYTVLSEMSNDFGKIDAFVGRITSVHNKGGAKDQIFEKLYAELTPEEIRKLREAVDANLKRLVKEYSSNEETALRDEELKYELIKRYAGDEKRAVREIEALQRSRFSAPVNFAQRLQDAILDESTPDSIAGKKTAIYLLKEYIIDAYAEYITEHKDAYPETIDLHINKKVALDQQLFQKYNIPSVKWAAKTNNGENLEQMKKGVQTAYKKAADSAIAQVKPSTGKMVAVAIFTLGIGALVMNKNFKKRSAEITNKYDKACKAQVARLDAAVSARVDVNKLVNDFVSQEGWDKLEIKGGM